MGGPRARTKARSESMLAGFFLPPPGLLAHELLAYTLPYLPLQLLLAYIHSYIQMSFVWLLWCVRECGEKRGRREGKRQVFTDFGPGYCSTLLYSTPHDRIQKTQADAEADLSMLDRNR